MALTIADTTVLENTTPRVSGTLYDDAGDVVPASSLLSLTLSLEDLKTATIINSRHDQDVLNANGVTVDESGVLTWLMDAADNPIVTERTQGQKERHAATFRWTWGDVANPRAGATVIDIYVEALDH